METVTYAMMRELEDDHWWFVARRQILERLIRLQNLPAAAEILEVGCGTGGNLSMLRKFGHVIGVEYDESAAQMAQERGLAPVHVGALPSALPDFAGRFDLICLFDVIEHIEDDAATLATLHQLLNPGGKIVLTAPAFPFLWSRHDEDNQHFRRYRLAGMRCLVEQEGLSLDYASYFNFWLFPPVAAVRLIRKVFPYEESWKDMRKPADGINRLLRAIFASERHLVGRLRLPFGISLVAVASE